MTSTTDVTRMLVERFFERLGAGERTGIANCFTEKGSFHPPRSMPFDVVRGAEQVAEFFTAGGLDHVLEPGSVSMDVVRIVADGEDAIAMIALRGTTRAGRDYANDYCWWFRCSSNAIEQVVEYTDTLHAAQQLGLGVDQ